MSALEGTGEHRVNSPGPRCIGTVDTQTLQRDITTGQLKGTYDDRFAPVVDEFARNFGERGEVGASLCITPTARRSSTCGVACADPKTGAPWKRDTVSIVHCCTKGATAICAHVLAARGQLDIDAPVAEYWPEFAAHGKETATVRMMLDHSVGVPVLRGESAPGELYDWDYMVDRLRAEEPFWEPGIRNGYHMINFGWTVGELVRRVSGRSLGTFFREEIAEPLGIDFWIGMPEEHEPRVAPMIAYAAPDGRAAVGVRARRLSDRTSVPSLALANIGGLDPNSRDGPRRRDRWRRRHHQRARPRRDVHAAGARRRRARRPRRRSTACVACRSATNRDATLCIPTRFALGFMVAWTTAAGRRPTRWSSASTPSATSAPAAASASPTRRAAWPSATR